MYKKYSIILLLILFNSYFILAQQYSFSIFAFKILDGDNVVTKICNVVGFENKLVTPRDMDSLSQFQILSIYDGDDVRYHRLARHKEGIWLLYAENVKKWRPIRFFRIEKKMTDGKTKAMNIFLNYNYHSCEMPCVFGQSEFKVSEIQFREGNYMFLDILKVVDWKVGSNKLVGFKEEIPDFIKENKIVFWDDKMKK
jgi:hypothetical protein